MALFRTRFGGPLEGDVGPPRETGIGEWHRFRQALLKALANAPAGSDLEAIAAKLRDAAAAGEPWAIQMVAERVDGKTRQAVEVTNTNATYVVVVPQLPISAAAWEQGAIECEPEQDPLA